MYDRILKNILYICGEYLNSSIRTMSYFIFPYFCLYPLNSIVYHFVILPKDRFILNEILSKCYFTLAVVRIFKCGV